MPSDPAGLERRARGPPRPRSSAEVLWGALGLDRLLGAILCGAAGWRGHAHSNGGCPHS